MADQVFQTLCAALDARNWKYKREDAKRQVLFGVRGRDIPMELAITVNADRQLIELMSILPCEIPSDKRIDAAIAATVANYGLYDGSIIYSIDRGVLAYRLTCTFCDAQIGQGLFHYMIDCACANVDMYNDRFAALAKGDITIQQFIELE